MTYIPTTWQNAIAPAINASNLNKIEDEIVSQAIVASVSYTRTTWVDGSGTAYTSAAPLDNMEEGIRLIHAAIGLPVYTKTLWPDKTKAARSAAMLNKIEQALANSRSYIDVVQPTPPGNNYTIPGTVTVVTTIAELETALAGTTPVNIKVMNGTYSRSTFIAPAGAHKIYCETYNGCFFNFGLHWAAYTGWKVHGGVWAPTTVAQIAFDGTSRYYVIGNYPGSSADRNATVTDVTVNGNMIPLSYGIYLGQVGGAVVQRCDVSNCQNVGVWVYDGTATSVREANIITDLNISHIYRPVRGEADGTYEHGFTVGNKVLNGIARLRIRDCGWTAVHVGNTFRDTLFTDVDADVIYGLIPIDSPGSTDPGRINGRMLSGNRFHSGCTFRRWRCGPDVVRGISQEWDEDLNYRLSTTYTIGNTEMFIQYGTFGTRLPASGTIYIGADRLTAVAITYTGKDGANSKLTGCSGGSGGPYAIDTFVSTVAGGRQASANNIFEDMYIDVSSTREPRRPRHGIQFSEGTVAPIFRRVNIRGADDSGVHDLSGTPHTTIQAESDVTYTDVTFALPAGALNYRYG